MELYWYDQRGWASYDLDTFFLSPDDKHRGLPTSDASISRHSVTYGGIGVWVIGSWDEKPEQVTAMSQTVTSPQVVEETEKKINSGRSGHSEVSNTNCNCR